MQVCKLEARNIIIVLVIALAPLRPLHAQDDCGDECKINSTLAMVVNVPVNPTAQVVGTGWGMVGGAGYNFNKRNAVTGEFVWNRVYPSGGVLQLGAYLIGGGGWYSPQYLALEGGHFRHRHRLHSDLALVGVHLHVGNGHCQPGRDNFQLKRIGRERRHRVHGKSWRSSLPALYGGALSLCSNQAHQHAVHSGDFRNPLLKKRFRVPTRSARTGAVI